MDTDRYGRVVAVCFRGDGVEVNAWLVRNGFAIDYRKYSRGRYLSEQSEAQRHKRGVWRGTFVNPDDYRRVKRGGGVSEAGFSLEPALMRVCYRYSRRSMVSVFRLAASFRRLANSFPAVAGSREAKRPAETSPCRRKAPFY